MKLQPKDIEKYCDKKEWRNYDEDGFTGEYVVSAKNIIDMFIDLKALNEPTTRADTSKANLNIPVVGNSTISDLIDYIENQEYNHLNKELLDFANDVQNKLKAMIHK